MRQKLMKNDMLRCAVFALATAIIAFAYFIYRGAARLLSGMILTPSSSHLALR